MANHVNLCPRRCGECGEGAGCLQVSLHTYGESSSLARLGAATPHRAWSIAASRMTTTARAARCSTARQVEGASGDTTGGPATWGADHRHCPPGGSERRGCALAWVDG